MRNLLLAAAICLAPSLASAHAILMSSSPPDGGTVAAGEQKLTFRYNSRIDRNLSKLILQGTNAQMDLPLDRNGPVDALVTQATLSPGTYVVHWQVLATDGHMTRGDVHFTVTAK